MGRTHELDELTAALSLTGTAPGPVQLITGAPGIGKTRLAREFTRAAETAGARVVWGYCSDDAPPYWPWTQIVRQLAGRGGTDLAELVLDEPAGVERFELFDAVAQVIGQVTELRPLVLVIDDLHDADGPSLLLTRFVARHLQGHPLVLVATMRPVDLWEPRVDATTEAVATIDSLRRLGRELQLGGLAVDDVGELVGNHDHAAQVHAITAGNPLFIEHVVRAGSSGTALRPAEDRSPLDTIDGLRRAVRARVESLRRPELEALQAAAVLGLRHSLDEVAALLGPDAPHVPAGSDVRRTPLLAEAESAGLVTVGAAGRSEFTHPLVAQMTLRATDPARLHVLHTRAAALIRDGDRVAERAHHLLQAGPDAVVAAVDSCRVAARVASAALAHEEASGHYRRALDAMSTDSRWHTDRLDLLLALGDTLWRSARTEESTAAFDDAWQVAVSIGDPRSLARAATRNGLEYYFAPDEGSPWPERIATALDAQPDGESIWKARLLAQLATHHLAGDLASVGEALAAESLAMARRSGDPRSTGDALVAEQVTAMGPSTLQRRIDSAHEILACAREADDYRLTIHGRFLLMGALLERGDIRGVNAELARQDGLVDELGEPRFARFGLWFRATRALLRGDPEEAERLAEECFRISNDIHDPDSAAVYGGQLGIARWMQGRILEVEPLFVDLRAGDPEDPLWIATLAWLWAGQGHRDAAHGALATFPEPSTVPHSLNWLVTMTAAADAAATAGPIDQVEAIWSELLPYSDRVVPVAMGAAVWGTVARPLGRLSMRLGRIEDGLQHLADAVAICARLGARPWLIEAQLELAGALEAHRPDDPRIDPLVAEATAAAEHLGLHHFLERARPSTAVVTVAAAADRSAVDPELGEAPRPAGESGEVARSAPTVNVLGAFEVVSAQGAVARWTSRKARELLKILVSRRGVPVTRETLMDLLWPGEDPAVLGNRLSVALSTVRRALDPDRRFDSDELVSAASDTVQLRLDVVEVDVERFLVDAAATLDAHRRGESPGIEAIDAVVRSHRGEALPDEPHAEWAAPLRAEVRTCYIAVARVLAAEAERSDDHLRAAAAHRRVLDADPYDEHAHLGVVSTFHRMGAHGQADAAYAAYSCRMAELGVPAAPDPRPGRTGSEHWTDDRPRRPA